MEVKIESKEIAGAITAMVEQCTGLDCEVFANQIGSVVVYNRTQVVARITSLFDEVDVEPVGGVFSGEIVEIPIRAKTVDELREIATALDEAGMRVTSAAAAKR